MDNGASSYLRFLEGDNDSFINLVREYNDGLILFINTIVNDIYTAEEAADDTLLKLYVDKPVYNHKASFKTWLYTIGRNTALNHIRRQKRHKHAPIEEMSHYSDNIDIEAEYIQGERNIIIHQCIKALKNDYAQVLFLAYFEELSNADIARVMGKSARQVTQLIYRAKQALKCELERRGQNGQI